ncbi:hypothetical protein STEG23_018828, partial [Scotinomys teguina]
FNEHGAEGLPTTPGSPTTIASPSKSVQPEHTIGYTHQFTGTTPSGYVLQNVTIKGKYQISFRLINWNLNNTDPTSSEYVTLERDIEDKVTTLYTGSQLQEVFQSCLVTNLTSGSIMVTIKALFSSYLDPNLVKQVFLNKTLNASSHWLGATYQLTDLHVIDMKPPVLLSTEIPTTTTTSFSSQHFNLNFTITNLPYSQDIAQPGTTKHQQNKRSIEYALNQLFRNSSIKSYFSDCQVLAFRSVSNSNYTGVDSLCNFSPLARRVDRVAIYEEFLRMTQNGTQLLNFTLDRKSVLVDGYSSNSEDDVIKNSASRITRNKESRHIRILDPKGFHLSLALGQAVVITVTRSSLEMKEEDVLKFLAAGTQLGGTNLDFQVEQYIYKKESDGIYIINLKRTWEKLLLAARAIAAIENPADVRVISSS